MSTNVLVVDDHRIIVDGIRLMLSREKDLKVVGEAASGEEALEYLAGNNPVDVAIVDLKMPGMNGVALTKEIKERFPHVKVLVLTMYSEGEKVDQIMEAGGEGYLVKNASKAEFVDALKRIAAGHSHYDAEAIQALTAHRTAAVRKPRTEPVRLTDREKEVLLEIAECYTSGEISANLNIAESTVETHRRNLIDKLGVKGTPGLVRWAVENGFVKAGKEG